MYAPLQIGIPRRFQPSVDYGEIAPGDGRFTYCYWTLATKDVLTEDFEYLVLPDGCVDIVFDLGESPFEGALVMTPDVTATQLNLGREFRYVGIRLRPGAWLGGLDDIVGQALHEKVLAGEDLRKVRQKLANAADDKTVFGLLEALAFRLVHRGIIGASPLTECISRCHTVNDYTEEWGFSRRHVQRMFRRHFGYSPHDFIKIIRFQYSLRQDSFEAYADQSHYSREFKRITHLTPREFQATYS